MEPELQKLSASLWPEVIKAFGLPASRPLEGLVRALVHRATDRLAEYGWRFDQVARLQGIADAARELLDRFCLPPRTSGAGCLPGQGPMVVVSNHPGTFDSLVLLSQIQRPDLRMIASKIPFIHLLPNASRYFIFVTQDLQQRMAVLRTALRQLKQNGVVVLFGSGRIDPDPAVYPDAAAELKAWYPSVDLLLRSVPQARLVLSVVSHVVSEKWARHPITWFRRGGANRRRLAEFGQMIQQLADRKRAELTPCISFSRPYEAEELSYGAEAGRLMPAILERETELLAEHVERYDCRPQLLTV